MSDVVYISEEKKLLRRQVAEIISSNGGEDVVKEALKKYPPNIVVNFHPETGLPYEEDGHEYIRDKYILERMREVPPPEDKYTDTDVKRALIVVVILWAAAIVTVFITHAHK